MPLAACASAPGKVILHGEHSVVYGHTALAASLGLRTTAAAREAAEPGVRLLLPDVRLQHSFPAECLGRHLPAAAADAWARPAAADHERLLAAADGCVAEGRGAAEWSAAQRDAVRGLLYLLAGLLGPEAGARGLTLSVRSELAPGAGTGSSAAFAVSAAAALLRLRALRAGAPRDAFSADDEGLISAWAFNCERIMHGAPSGVDNATCTFGGLVWFRRGQPPRALRAPAALRVLLVDTRVARQTSALTERVAQRRARDPAAVDCVLRACGHVADSAVEILEALSDREEDPDPAYERLGELWDTNHCLLAALGVSHRALDDVRRLAAQHGLAAKLTGAGGGGFALVLLPPGADEAALRALRAALRAAGYAAQDARLGGAGVRLHAPAETTPPNE